MVIAIGDGGGGGWLQQQVLRVPIRPVPGTIWPGEGTGA
jgi:hypothetical protein